MCEILSGVCEMLSGLHTWCVKCCQDYTGCVRCCLGVVYLTIRWIDHKIVSKERFICGWFLEKYEENIEDC